jgi:outer membrane protein OmpA-like peptidoglycan-associated protein
MRRVLALFLMLVAAPAFGQNNTLDLKPGSNDFDLQVLELGLATLDFSPATLDLRPASLDFGLVTLDLVLPVQNMITVTQVAKEVKIELPADVLFDFDKADIRPDAAVALTAAADLLKKGVVGAIKIDGHTDSKGAAAYNLTLSQNRARSVQAWFVKNGLPANQAFTLTGYGAARPKVPNARPDGSDDPNGRQTNRRVEITFTPR